MSGPGVAANFEPIYAALFQLLQNSASVTFSGTANGAVVTGIADTSKLFPGIAIVGVDGLPGLHIQSVDSASRVTLDQPLPADGAVTLKAGYMTSNRLLQHWSDVTPGMQPALYQAEGDEESKKRPGQPPIWGLDLTIWVYCYQPALGVSAQPTMNALLANIRQALAPDASGYGRATNSCTLGGLCQDCFINGKILKDDGLLGPQAVARIPIHINQNGPL